jgi:hypothetical protein
MSILSATNLEAIEEEDETMKRKDFGDFSPI